MAVILTNINGFVEQVGRRRMHRRSGRELDTLDCVFVGLQSLVASALPSDGAPHPVYPGMTCTGWEVTDREALLCEVHVTYIGKFSVGVPLVNTSYSEGSISWTTFVGATERVLVPGHYYTSQTGLNGAITQSFYVKPITGTSYLSQSFTCRFTLETVTTTIASRSRGGVGGGGGGAVLRQLVYNTGASLSDSRFGLVTATLVFEPQNDVTTTDLGNGWFENSVVSTMRPVINSSVDLTQPAAA